MGTVTLELLAERGFDDVRAFASARSAGRTVRFGERELLVEEATPEALAAGELDLVFFSVGTDASRELVPHAVRGGAVVIDKSDAYRLQDGIPLVVAGVNDHVLNGNEIVANPNCSAMQLACVLEPLHEAAGLGARAPGHLPVGVRGRRRRHRAAAEHRRRPRATSAWTGSSTARSSPRSGSSAPRRARSSGCPICRSTRRACACPCSSATRRPCGSRPSRRSRRTRRAEALAASDQIELADLPTPADAAGRDKVLVGRIRRDTAGDGLALWIVNDNLRKGAALNAVQIAELLLARRLLAA